MVILLSMTNAQIAPVIFVICTAVLSNISACLNGNHQTQLGAKERLQNIDLSCIQGN
jgi:hypothetical protein